MSKLSKQSATERSKMLKEVSEFLEQMSESHVTDTKRRAILFVAIDREVEGNDVPSVVGILGDLNTLGPGLAGIFSENDTLKHIISKAMMSSVLYHFASHQPNND